MVNCPVCLSSHTLPLSWWRSLLSPPPLLENHPSFPLWPDTSFSDVFLQSTGETLLHRRSQSGPMYVRKVILFPQFPTQSQWYTECYVAIAHSMFNTRIWVWALRTLSLVSSTDFPPSFFSCQVHLFPKIPVLLPTGYIPDNWGQGTHISLVLTTVNAWERTRNNMHKASDSLYHVY